MSGYKTEGYIKTIKVAGSGVTFTIDAAEPYVFESKDNKEAVPTRKILLVADAGGKAKIVVADSKFKIGGKKSKNTQPVSNNTVETDAENVKVDYTALLIAKANHMKVRLMCENGELSNVKELEVL